MKNASASRRFSSCSQGLWRLIASLSLLVLASSLHADESNVLRVLREKLTPPSAVWGEPRVGTSVRVEPDPRATAFLQSVQQILQSNPQTKGAGVRPVVQVNPAQQDPVGHLKALAGPDLQVHVRPGNGTIMQLRGGLLERAPQGPLRAADAGQPERTARSFMRNNRTLLRIDDPDLELKLDSVQRLEDGTLHLRFSQWYREIPLWPSGLSVHLNQNGDVESLDGAYVPTPVGIATKPLFTAEEAVAGAKTKGDGEASDPSLIVYSPLNQPARLAWKFRYEKDLALPPQIWTQFCWSERNKS